MVGKCPSLGSGMTLDASHPRRSPQGTALQLAGLGKVGGLPMKVDQRTS